MIPPRDGGGYFLTIADNSHLHVRLSMTFICIECQEAWKRPHPIGRDRFAYSGFGPTVIWTKSAGRNHLAKASLT